ncbi:hypothetical protein JM18_008289 [Phytophthora kernoviae]|uniref:Mediator of RNA polymerase II transcription subunit 10 n=2 Tax=Phytophthora kernoviae TaxID=325452 RepID=A0A8T0LMT1_9STRA|nr:hypothetical protein JM16_008304 [Phytophthora kernoviae]KAG2514608.1 hypothetical protein JM18_008289 [Phytophthora kernoviae]
MVRQRLYGTNGAMCASSKMDIHESDIQFVPDDVLLYDDYLQSMDAIYAQTDKVFQACGGVEKTPQFSFKSEPQRKQDGDVEYFENLDVLLIPYSFEQTCNAMWQSMLFVHRQKDRRQYSGVTDPENTIAVKFRIPCPREYGEPVNMLIHFVTRSVGGMSRCEYDMNQFTKLVIVSGEEDGVEVAHYQAAIPLQVLQMLDTEDGSNPELFTKMQLEKCEEESQRSAAKTDTLEMLKGALQAGLDDLK